MLTKPSVLEIEGEVYARNININMQDMVLRSIFSYISNKLKSSNIGVGFNYNDVRSVLDGVSAHVSFMDSSWIDKITTVLGSEKVNIVLSGVLQIVGSMLVNAERENNGQLTDRGKLTIKAAELIGVNLVGYR